MTGRGAWLQNRRDGELDLRGGDAGDGYKCKVTERETVHLHIH